MTPAAWPTPGRMDRARARGLDPIISTKDSSLTPSLPAHSCALVQCGDYFHPEVNLDPEVCLYLRSWGARFALQERE